MLKEKFNLIWILVVIITICGLATAFAKNNTKQYQPLEISITSSMDSYILGEPVNLTAKVTNVSDKDVSINKVLTLESGHLQTLIAKEDDQEFRRYLGPGWGVDERNIQYNLNPQQSISDSDSILWNLAPRTSHLNKDAAKKAMKRRLPTSYAFSERGVYRIKVRLVSNGYSYESNELTVVIEEPQGDDREIWKTMQKNPELGFFIQVGYPKSYKKEDKSKLNKDLENLLSKFPNGQVAKSINKRLEMNKQKANKIKKPY